MKRFDEFDRSNSTPPGERGVRPLDLAPIGALLQESLPDWPATWSAYVRRAHNWKVPPRWGPRDWWEELDAEALAAAYAAVRAYHDSRGLTRSSYVFHRMVATTMTRFRREWAYGLSFLRSPSEEPMVISDDDRVVALEEGQQLCAALGRLKDSDRRLIERLFWEGCSEAEIATDSGISQQATSKRKLRVLRQLRRVIEIKSENSE